MKPKETTESIWTHICLKPRCSLYLGPQKYSRICKSDVVEIAKKEEKDDVRPVDSH